ncbi:MAG: deoxyribonuclease IV [Verrucomicrobiota bacterium]|nr:deoxyribonuclease IV [Verrucomicrobiota bacterium]
MSTSGGASTAIDRALSIDCNAMQIFVKNNMQWFAPAMSEKEAGGFCNHPRRAEVKSVFGHSGYMINLAASNPQFHAKSVRALREELVRADQLQLPFLVLHPGAHTGAGEEPGLQKVVSSLDEVFAALPKIKTRVALETTAGQGSCLGDTFEHLAFILANAREPERLCVCIDTAHLFAAGYDLTSAAATRKTLAQFNKIVGLRWLAAIHLNDSKTARGSHVDRHEHIGKGQIGLEAFRYIMNEPALAKIPKVLETPKEKAMLEDVENLRTLRGLIISANHQ